LGSFVADDGVVIAYRDAGDGRPLLMLHGLNADSRLFDAQAEALSATCRVIRPDFRGHGQSDGGTAPDMARLARDIAALVGELDLHDIVGIGWSLGAMVLWRLLLGAEAGRFAGAIVVDMTARVPNAPGWTLGLIDETLRAAPEHESADARGRRIAHAVLAEGRADDGLADRIAPLLVQRDTDAVAAIGASLFDEDFRDALPRIAVPTIVAHGAASRYYSHETATWVAGRLPDARVVRFAHSGHAPHVEEPDAFNDMVAGFVRERDANGQSQTNGRIDA
jgi:pimeloyl-ACP methyl ester carboxylesterase